MEATQEQEIPSIAIPSSSPADAAFRHLARLCEERTVGLPAAGEGPDLRLLWDYCRQTALRLAQWCRRLPTPLLGKINASHVAAGFSVVQLPRQDDGDDRRVHRVVSGQLNILLQSSGVQPAGDLYTAGALWAMLQSMALSAAVSIEEPRIKSPGGAEQAKLARAALMRYREHLVADLSEMMLAGAAVMLKLDGQASAEGAEAPPAAEGAPPAAEGAPPAAEPAAAEGA